MGFRVVPIQRRSEAVKIFLLFCVPPIFCPAVGRNGRFSRFCLFFLCGAACCPRGNAAAFARIARGAMRAQAPAIGGGGFAAAAADTPARRGYARRFLPIAPRIRRAMGLPCGEARRSPPNACAFFYFMASDLC